MAVNNLRKKMKTKKLSKILVLSILGLFVLSCGSDRSREDQVSAMINKIEDPFTIVSLNPQNLMDKSGVEDGAVPFTFEMITGLFLEDSVTGIDYSVKIQMVVASGKGFTPTAYGIFRVADSEKFEEMLDKEANAKIKEKEGFTYAIQEGDGYVVVWNEEFAIVSSIPMDFAAMLTGGGGDQGEGQVNVCIDLMKAADEGEINDEYSTFLKHDDDVCFYYDGKGMFGYLEAMTMGEAEELDQFKDIYEGMGYEMFLNFNDGSIDLNWTANLTDDLREKLSFIGKGGVDKKLLSYGNSANPVLVGTYNVNFPDLFDFMEDMLDDREMDEMEEGLEEIGLTIDDVKSAISGEILYSIDRIETKEEIWDYGYGEPYTYKTTEPVAGVAIKVTDRSVIEKALKSLMDIVPADQMDLAKLSIDDEEMMALFEEMAYGPKIEEQANGVLRIDEAYMFLGKDVLFISNDSAWSQKVAQGKGVKIKDPNGDLGKNPFGIYANFTTLAKMEDLDDAEPFVKMFTEFSGGANLDEGHFSLKLKNKSKNSLRILTEVISDELNRLDEMKNPELKEELDEAIKALEELDGEDGMGCEAGACEAGACEGGK